MTSKLRAQQSDSRSRPEARRLALELALLVVSVASLAAGLLLAARLGGGTAAWPLFGLAYLASGWKVLAGAARNLLRGRMLDETFLMTVATLGGLAIGAFEEAVGVMVFYKAGELAQSAAVGRSRRSIRALLALRPDAARVRAGDGWQSAAPEEVAVGSEVLVKAGERIPLDGTVTEGSALVNTAPLTGEPLPRPAGPGSAVLAGTTPIDGPLVIRADRPAGQSSAARVIELVESAARAKAPTERLVSRLARVYTPVVVALAAVVAFAPPLLVAGARLGDWVYRALVLLVISCPCALVVSVPLGYVGGIGGAARRGILVKGAAALDALASARAVVFDKTGTLTKGLFRVARIVPGGAFKAHEVLGMAAAAEAHSNHPVAASIRSAWAACGRGETEASAAADHREIGGRGVSAMVGSRRVLAGNDGLMHDEGIPHDTCSAEGTVVHVAVDGRYAGYLVIADEPREDAAEAVASLHSIGVERVAILTGDRAAVAESLGRAIGVSEVHADLLPEGKLERLEAFLAEASDGRRSGRRRGSVVFVGDGINDAPVLARADVGIAMGRDGADAAVQTADVVLSSDHPSRVAEAIRRARRTRAIVLQNIVFALATKGVFLALGAAGVATLWEAVIADMGVTLLAILNSARALR